MAKYSFLFVLLASGHWPTAQNCDCASAFLFLKNQIENNYSGYKDKVQPANKKAFDSFTGKLISKAKKTNKLHYCLGIQREWLSFFKDGHIQLNENNVPAIKDSIGLKKLIEETEVIKLDPKKNSRVHKSGGVEGVYYSVDSTYKIVIVKNKSMYRDYAGIIIHSKTSSWKPGQVKLELKELSQNKFIGYAYYQDHSGRAAYYEFDGNTLNRGTWIKEGAPAANNSGQNRPPIQAKKVNEKTFYIQISSFDPWNAPAIDSVFKTHENILKSIPNLILDLRGNAGGADFAYAPISPYLYTNPVHNVGVDVIASADNIQAWTAVLDEPDLPESTKNAIAEMTEKMKLYPGQLVNIVPDDTTILEKIEPFPKRIAILTDGHCASSTEQFLLSARQSKKAILMGQNSKGVLDYANMRSVSFPDCPLILAYATTRSRRIDLGQGIDNKGIKPDRYLPMDKDWIAEAIKYLEE
jgi:hypothetical protein